MKSGSFMYLFVYYLFFNHVNAQNMNFGGMWGRSFAGNSNMEMNGSGSIGKIYTEVSSHGVSSSSGFLDPMQSVKQAMAKASVDMNPIKVSSHGMSSSSGFLDPMQSVKQAMAKASVDMNPINPIQPVQVMSKSSFHDEPMRFQIHDQNLQSQHGFFNQPQSMQPAIIKSSTNRQAFRGSNAAQTETQHNDLGAFSTRNPVFPTRKRGTFRPAIASVPGAFDMAVSGITVRNVGPAVEVTQAPKEQSSNRNTHRLTTTNFRQEATTTPSSIRHLVQGVKETGKGSELAKRICIQISDPEYNTLCLMKTEGMNETREKQTVRMKLLKKKETVKDTFSKADNLVSIIARGLCAYCCHTKDQKTCVEKFCDNKLSC